MNYDFKKYGAKKIDETMLFTIAIFTFILLLSPLLGMVYGILGIYNKADLVYDLLNSIFLSMIGFIMFKVSKSFNLQITNFLKMYIITTIIIYILTFSFTIIDKIFWVNNIYFKGKFSYIILLISFANIILTIIILIKISNKIRKVKFKNDSTSRRITSIITLFVLILSLIYTLSFGYIGVLLAKPEEIEVTHKNIQYNIRVDGFLVARDESTFRYNKSINLFLMKKLNDDEVPNEILAENNDYY